MSLNFEFSILNKSPMQFDLVNWNVNGSGTAVFAGGWPVSGLPADGAQPLSIAVEFEQSLYLNLVFAWNKNASTGQDVLITCGVELSAGVDPIISFSVQGSLMIGGLVNIPNQGTGNIQVFTNPSELSS